VNFYYRHIGDYLKDTAHLSLLEHGIYGRLLDVYYSRESPLPGDQIARLVGAKTDEERAALLCVLNEFFVLDGDGAWVQNRCDKEIAHYQEKQRKAKASADASWESRRAKQPLSERNATAMPTHSEGNAPNTSTNTNKEKRPARKRATPLPEGFMVSTRVGEWAGSKGHSLADVRANFEAFLSYAKRKGATYVDWDEALMTAIREDWAKARQPARGDVVTATVPYRPPGPNSALEQMKRDILSSEDKARADLARKAALASIRNITPRAA
jgi:uncharacterized protein YdaU (DUF1376 family)